MKAHFTKQIMVQNADIDELNHVNNVRYIQWIQDISKDHWLKVSKGKLSKAYIWVVASHFVEYKSSALLGDQLSISTYVEKFEGPISFRAVEIINTETNRMVVKAMTKWCLVDIESKRPIPIPEEIIQLDL